MVILIPILTSILGLCGPVFARSVNGSAVQTSNGEIIGHKSHEYPDVVEYLGIPYAAPPVGKLRFEPPEPYKGGSNYVASHYVSLSSLWFSMPYSRPPINIDQYVL